MAHTSDKPTCTTRRAVILAAGESKRTRPLTLHRPKPLIPLLDRPLLAHILDQLVGLVEHATLVVGYRADDIRRAFGSTYQGIALDYVTQHTTNGTAGALLAVAEQVALDEPFFLLYGDNLIAQVDVLNVCQQRYCMAGLPVEDPSAFGVLDTQGNRVRRIIEKSPDAPPGSLANPGIYHLDGEVLPLLHHIQPSPRGELELTDLIALLAQSSTVGYTVCQGHWLPVGTPWDVLVASQFLLAQKAALRPVIAPNATIAPDCHIEGYVHIGQATIGAGCHIRGPAFIADGVTIGQHCTLERSALHSGASVSDHCTIRTSALGSGASVGNHCTLQSSLLDQDAAIGARSTLNDQVFDDITTSAATTGLLETATLRRHGSVLGRGVNLPEAATPESGSIIFPDAHSPAN